ncbi:nucleotidyltransferase family protein [Roseiflexus sp. AH-315-K22]|nr:nucleotidyltransferase family protein [Roseiflexus sp. AH-315-K22]
MIANLDISPDRIARFCRDWKISELALFGSVLRDDYGPDSDIDLLVTFEPDARWSLFDIVRLKRAFEEIAGRKVDVIEKPTLEKHHNPYLKHAILTKARTIYTAA